MGEKEYWGRGVLSWVKKYNLRVLEYYPVVIPLFYFTSFVLFSWAAA